MSSFVHLHVHSCYSILDGMSSISGLVDKAIKNGVHAIALTDHGAMYGIKEFWDYATKVQQKFEKELKELEKDGKDKERQHILSEQIEALKAQPFKPILGCEAYVAKRTRFDKTTKEDRRGNHLVLLAKNKKGYQNLCKLISAGFIEGHYYCPRIDKELLKQYHEGLIVLSGCLGGEIHKKIEDNDIQGAKDAAQWYKDLFGDDYYIEIQRHKTDKEGADTEVFEKQELQNADLISIAKELDIPIVATNDVHFVEESHAEAHDRLICLSTGKDLDDPARMRYTKQEWLKTPQEMEEIFSDLPEAIANTERIADKIEYYSLLSLPIMPTFEIPKEFGTEEIYREKYSHEDLLAEFEPNEADKGRIEKLGGFEKAYRIKLESDYLRMLTMEKAKARYGDMDTELLERIDFELATMRNMGFPGYFLIVHEIIEEARKMGVSVGPGRGSAAGSVVAYCLEITNIDPMKYDLLFERFLNPDRISMPDIDIDFDDEGRSKVFDWTKEKYGEDRVANIITYGTMATKSSIKDVARVQKLPLDVSNALTKQIPNVIKLHSGETVPVTIANCIKHIPEIKDASESSDINKATTIKYAAELEGTVRQTSTHACGVIIGAEKLDNFIPLATAEDKEFKKTKEGKEHVIVTQYEGSTIEDVGLIKMDFLGLKTLSIIKETLSNIKKRKGIDIDIDAIPLDDAATYELFSEGATVAIFQFESDGMQKHLKDLKPTKFEDLIAMNALYRPGPMQYIPLFIRRKNGKEDIEYDFPEMEKRLSETYGVTVYQEQVMLLSRDLAGFTRGQSDELRKAMGKKIQEKMAPLKVEFMKGATERGFGPEDKLEKIWKDWEEFAKYAFNKSHATCYSWLAYQTGFLKTHYPAEFMAANLTHKLNNITEISLLISECQRMNISVLGPDVNESELNFTVMPEGEIRFGLAALKGVGEAAANSIIIERNKNGKYVSTIDLLKRINLRACNRKCLEALISAGGFEGIETAHRAQFFAETKNDAAFIDFLIKKATKIQQETSSAQISIFGNEDIEDPSEINIEFPTCEPWSVLEQLRKEKEVCGFYISGHPLDRYKLEIENFCNYNINTLKSERTLVNLKDKTVVFAGMITDASSKVTKNGKEYGRFTIEDYDDNMTLMLFGEHYLKFKHLLLKDVFVLIEARVSLRYGKEGQFDEDYELRINNMQLLDEVLENNTRTIELSIDLASVNDELIATIAQCMRKKGKTANLKIKVFYPDENMNVDLSVPQQVGITEFCQEIKKISANVELKLLK